MKKECINLPGVTPIAPYSPAVVAGDFVFVSGQVGYDMATRQWLGDDIRTQAKGALENLKEVLELAGSNLQKVVKVNIYLNDVNDFATVNEIYKDYFVSEPPARTCFQIAKIPLGGLIEIEAIALK